MVPAATKRWSAAEHEAGLALFVTPEWRNRFRAILAMDDRKRRAQLSKHCWDRFDARFDRRYARLVEPKVFQRLLPILQAKGAPQMCYVLSTDDELVRQELLLDEVWGLAHDSAQTENFLVSCVPGLLGFYSDHEWYTNRWILERTEGC